MISVIVPVYNEAKTLPELHRRILDAMKSLGQPFEIIFVNDGSTDATIEIGKTLRPLRLITLQRNSGQTAALDVGIHRAVGEIIVLIDADLQNDPADIPKLLKKLDDGYDVVVGWRQERFDHWKRKVVSKVANMVARSFLGLDIHDFGCGLKVYRSRFIKDFRLWGESQVFLPAVAQSRGARIAEVVIPHHARKIGSSKIRIMNMVRGTFDFLGIVFFVRYLSRPLRFFGGLGVVAGIISILAFGSAIILRLNGVLNFSDTPLPIIGTLFAILSVLLIMMGLIAEMLLRLHYTLTQSSPYLIREIWEKQ
jgi:glycosyltransferase involved in cell wall biosynthesis